MKIIFQNITKIICQVDGGKNGEKLILFSVKGTKKVAIYRAGGEIALLSPGPGTGNIDMK